MFRKQKLSTIKAADHGYYLLDSPFFLPDDPAVDAATVAVALDVRSAVITVAEDVVDVVIATQ